MELSPVVIFCYNRLWHMQKAIEALQKNELANESELFIFSDGYKTEDQKNKVLEVRKYIRSIKGFKNITIIERDTNYGVSKSSITGVSEIISKFGKVIFLEDDSITSPFFLKYMNESLSFYENDSTIFSITGFNPPFKLPNDYHENQYLTTRPCAWGWASWKNRWDNVDWNMSNFDSFIRDKQKRKIFNHSGNDSTAMLLNQKKGKIDSWAIRFYFSCFEQNKYCVYPRYSLLYNIGFDGSGSQLIRTKKYDIELSKEYFQPTKVVFNENVLKSFKYIYEPSVVRKLINFYKIHKYLYYLKRV